MKTIYICLLFFIPIIFYSFCFGFGARNKEDVLSDRLVKKVREKLKAEYGLFLAGIGGGVKEKKIRQISASFGRYGNSLNQKLCRKLILDCIHIYLDEINSNTEIRPYLLIYPFKEKDLDISIINFYKDHSIALDPDICAISAINGKIYYRTCTSLRSPYNSEVVETYEEALAIVKGEQLEKENLK